jgi:hypothetical protein
VNPSRTPHGFKFGAADVSALCSDSNKGWTMTRIETPKAKVDVYVTKTGKTRVYFNGLEVATGK